jgi:hypothetical protein
MVVLAVSRYSYWPGAGAVRSNSYFIPVFAVLTIGIAVQQAVLMLDLAGLPLRLGKVLYSTTNFKCG